MFFGKHNHLIPLRLVCKCLILVKNLNFLWPPENGNYFFPLLICWALVSPLRRSKKKAVPRSKFNIWPGAWGSCATFIPPLGGWDSSPALLSPNWTDSTRERNGDFGKSNIATYGTSVAGESHNSSNPLRFSGFYTARIQPFKQQNLPLGHRGDLDILPPIIIIINNEKFFSR